MSVKLKFLHVMQVSYMTLMYKKRYIQYNQNGILYLKQILIYLLLLFILFSVRLQEAFTSKNVNFFDELIRLCGLNQDSALVRDYFSRARGINIIAKYRSGILIYEARYNKNIHRIRNANLDIVSVANINDNASSSDNSNDNSIFSDESGTGGVEEHKDKEG